MTKAERNYALLLAVIAVVVSVPVYVVCRAYGMSAAHAVTFGALAVTVVNLGMAAWNLSRLQTVRPVGGSDDRGGCCQPVLRPAHGDESPRPDLQDNTQDWLTLLDANGIYPERGDGIPLPPMPPPCESCGAKLTRSNEPWYGRWLCVHCKALLATGRMRWCDVDGGTQS